MIEARVVTDDGEFQALRDDWNDLVARTARPSAFLSHEWFDAAWQWRRARASLHVVCCRDGARLVGVLPVVREGTTGALRTLEFLTVPDTQSCDVILDRAVGDRACSAIADALMRARPRFDVLHLRYLPAESQAVRVLAPILAARRAHGDVRHATDNLFVPLTTPWDAYYSTRSRRLKKAVNLAANRLARAGDIAIERCTHVLPEKIDTLVAELAQVSGRSWKQATGNALDQPGPNAFIRRLTGHASARGWLSVWTLRSAGRLLAMEYQLVADQCVYALRSDFDEAYEDVSPGSHLSRRLLEQLFALGLDRYLMGPGSNEYKLRWAAGSDPVFELAIYAPTLRGRAASAWLRNVKPRLRAVRDKWRATRPDAVPEKAGER